MKTHILPFGFIAVASLFASPSFGHEAQGRGGHKDVSSPVVEADFFTGGGGYMHGGAGLLMPLNEEIKAGLMFHAVREESGGSWFPSIGAELGRVCESGIEVEAFSFGYLPVDGLHAWALGARVLKAFEPAEGWTVSPFAGPSFARVRAEDTDADAKVDVSHTMLLGGVVIAREPFEVRIFGTHSWFSRGVKGLETRVDLEEMTHLGAYVNNDGFARNSVGTELEWELCERVSLGAQYAAIFFPGESTRHSVALLPTVAVSSRLSLSLGAQWLKGAGADDVLFASGLTWKFSSDARH